MIDDNFCCDDSKVLTHGNKIIIDTTFFYGKGERGFTNTFKEIFYCPFCGVMITKNNDNFFMRWAERNNDNEKKENK